MRRFLLFAVLLMIGFSTTALYGQSIRNWSYYKMNSWDTSPYKAFRFTASNGQALNFRLLYPKNYNPNIKYPMIVMLHGYGEAARRDVKEFYSSSDPRYDNNDHQLLHGGREHLNAYYQNKFNGFILFAQNEYGSWISGKGEATSTMHRDMVKLLELIDYLVDDYISIDPFRVYGHGLSQGANAIWYAAYKRPDIFAAILPMSGAGDIAMVPTLQYHPIWLFQGGQDNNPSPWVADRMINELKKAGAQPKYTVYPNTGHGTWYAAYADANFFPFMNAQHKLNIHVAFGKDNFCGNESFSTRMGISPGYQAYEWRRNGQVISGATSNSITVSQYGDYQVRVKRKGVWSDWGAIRTIRDRCGTTTNRAPVFNAASDMSVKAGESVSQTIRASDPDGDAVSLSMASGAPSFVSFKDNGSGNGTLTANPATTIAGDFFVTIRATDGKLTSSRTIKISVAESGGGGGTPGEVVYRINAGGQAINASPLAWVRDDQSVPYEYLDAGSNNNVSGASSFKGQNTTDVPDMVFATMRIDYSWQGPVRYNLPVSNGTYEVKMYFAESPYSVGVNAAGERVFDVKIENSVVLNDYDIYARVGKNADMRSATVNVGDGTLNIELVRQVGNPQINGIEVIRSSSTATTTTNTKTSTTTQSAAAAYAPATEVSVYPTVFKDELTVKLESELSAKAEIRIIDFMGRTFVKQETKLHPAGVKETLRVQGVNMPRGMYLLEVNVPESGEVQRIRILKME